jgi:subtilisin family serine protease
VSVGRYSRRVAAAAVAVLAAAGVTLASGTAFADQVRHREWWLQALHVPTAWESTRGGGVTVALLDTGTDPAQADLAGSVITGPDYTHSGRLPGSPEWGRHGTAMASLIAGHGHGTGRASGIIGVAPAAKILSVRVTLEAGDPLLGDPNVARGLPDAIAKGIRYAVAHGASVIDLPLDPVTTPGAPGAGGSAAERAAVAYALRRNVVVVAPAGDDGAGSNAVNYPAAYPGVISVGAFNAAFVKAPFSIRQRYVTVTAPGAGTIAARTPAGYTRISSTSAASALVAGIAALIRAQFPALTPARVTRALTSATVYRPAGGRASGSGYGTVDAGLALLAAARYRQPAGQASQPASPVASPRRPVVTAQAPAREPAPGRGNTVLVAVAGGTVALVLLAGISVTVIAARRRGARAARLAPIRLSAQLQPRQALLAGTSPAGTGGRPTAPAVVTVAGQAGDPSRGAGGPRPPAALPWRAIEPGGESPHSPAQGGSGVSGNGSTDESAAGDAAAGRGNPGGGWALPMRQPGSDRGPRISGSPPWGPAPKPESELPWTDTPARRPAARASGSGPLPRRKPPEPVPSPWDLLAEETWPGGPASGRPQPPRRGAASHGAHAGQSTGDGGSRRSRIFRSGAGEQDTPRPADTARPAPRSRGGAPGAATPGAERTGPGNRPGTSRREGETTEVRRVYSWNPSAVTESLPAIKPEPGEE